MQLSERKDTIFFFGGGALVVVAIVLRQSSLAKEHLFQDFVIFVKSHIFQSGYHLGKQGHQKFSNRDPELLIKGLFLRMKSPNCHKKFSGKMPLTGIARGIVLVIQHYRGTGPKFCMFHKRGLLPLPPVEQTKLRSCTSVRGAAGSVRNGRPQKLSQFTFSACDEDPCKMVAPAQDSLSSAGEQNCDKHPAEQDNSL